MFFTTEVVLQLFKVVIDYICQFSHRITQVGDDFGTNESNIKFLT